MDPTNEELLSEVKRLREEIAQLREIVSALFNVVFEDVGDEEGGDDLPGRDDDFSLYT
jgi:hypothetical protein